MIDLYFSPTPNGLKIRLFLEETGLPYRLVPVRLSAGEQFAPAFLSISPNNKIPAIVDHAPLHGETPLPVFESGAILLYLAEKSDQLLPADGRARVEATQWLFWQVAGLGPMAGQAGYFRVYASEPQSAAIERYTREVSRLYGVLDRRLEGRDFIAGGAYSIADLACYPWVVPHAAHGQTLSAFPNVERWFERIKQRPATQRVYDSVEDVYTKKQDLSAEARQVLFHQGTAPAAR
ncbi:glutathione binding-like protein [Pyxidicoccus sp. MSG2]|uniref:glutathione binding-like protein n=1 Tax=Pyxidicoccus sp. MSG2 TaxID=2996790 RepID=UPI002271D882|nr:glutathione binding-like protein [Pyxidicoccus sp. MSG2]MCY1019126.1 glutathione binding-like protein [Pyxidicoccus sp. MSG2]